MTIQLYAEKVKVTPRTISNDIKAGRLTATLIIGAKRPMFDIDIHKHPIASYIKRKAGRPKGSKNVSSK